jgi:hypothetical protein
VPLLSLNSLTVALGGKVTVTVTLPCVGVAGIAENKGVASGVKVAVVYPCQGLSKPVLPSQESSTNASSHSDLLKQTRMTEETSACDL